MNVADEFSDDLSVSVGLEHEPFAGEEGLDVFVVGDDPVVDN